MISLALEIEPHFAAEAKRRRKETEGRPSKLVENVPPVSRLPKSRDRAAASGDGEPTSVTPLNRARHNAS